MGSSGSRKNDDKYENLRSVNEFMHERLSGLLTTDGIDSLPGLTSSSSALGADDEILALM